jgi:hypothetical protein
MKRHDQYNRQTRKQRKARDWQRTTRKLTARRNQRPPAATAGTEHDADHGPEHEHPAPPVSRRR